MTKFSPFSNHVSLVFGWGIRYTPSASTFKRSVPVSLTRTGHYPVPSTDPKSALHLAEATLPRIEATGDLTVPLGKDREFALAGAINRLFNEQASLVLGLPEMLAYLGKRLDHRLESPSGQGQGRRVREMRDLVGAIHAESLATLDQFNQRTMTPFEAVERLRLGGAQLSQGSLLRDQRILSRTSIAQRAQMVTNGSMTLDELPTAIAEVVRHRLTGIESDLTPILERFLHGNLRLVHAVAREFAVDEGGREELIGVGNLTLLRCAREFNPGLGFRFSTYAFPSIKHAMGDALANLRRGDAPKAPGGEKRRVVSYSLETPVKHRDDNQTLREVIPDPKAESPRDAVMRSEEDQVSRRLVQRALDSLPTEERVIVKRFFGLSGSEHTSIADIAVELKLSREQVRQRLARATRFMRISLIEASAPALTALGLID